MKNPIKSEHDLEVFGPHYPEQDIPDQLDLFDAVAFMNKGYIL